MTQLAKDVCAAGLLLLALAAYSITLCFYLQALEHQLPLMLALAGTLVLAILQSVSARALRTTLYRLIATTMTFVVGVLIANEVRLEYVSMMVELATIPDITQAVGTEYASMATNKIVGYGGCFATGLLVARWIIGERGEQMISRLFGAQNDMASLCPHCNQPL